VIHFRSHKKACQPMVLTSMKRDDRGNLCVQLDGVTVLTLNAGGHAGGCWLRHELTEHEEALLMFKGVQFTFDRRVAINDQISRYPEKE